MICLPVGFRECLREIHNILAEVPGYLSPRETSFLALLAACPTSAGEILEIGTYRGRSAIALAKAAQLADRPRITLVDPLPPTGMPTLLDKHGQPSGIASLKSFLRKAGVLDHVEIWAMTSGAAATKWDRPLRLLWIDGDHSYAGAKLDFDEFSPHLVDGAIIAFHDILNLFQCVRVFREEVLQSPYFGPVGMCGSIGWARYSRDPARCRQYAAGKARLSKRLAALARFDPETTNRNRLTKLSFRLRRWLVPHAAPSPQKWLKQVA